MYAQYYGLVREPFGLSPDARFCYRHPSFRRGKAYLEYALSRGEGFVVITGRPGTGKTTLVQDLLGDLKGSRYVAARIDTTQIGADDLLRLVVHYFGVRSSGSDKATLLIDLGAFLQRNAREGKRAVLVVDEAQNLQPAALEELRLITNLEIESEPLVQIFLVGQEALQGLIRDPRLEQLHQRILACHHLEPLDLAETRSYIAHRLALARWSGDPSISGEGVKRIHRASAGIPRLINKICDRLLVYGFLEEKHALGADDIRLVLGELRAELLSRIDEPDWGPSEEAADELGSAEIPDIAGAPPEERSAVEEPDVAPEREVAPVVSLAAAVSSDAPPASSPAGDRADVPSLRLLRQAAPEDPPPRAPTPGSDRPRQSFQDPSPVRKGRGRGRPWAASIAGSALIALGGLGYGIYRRGADGLAADMLVVKQAVATMLDGLQRHESPLPIASEAGRTQPQPRQEPSPSETPAIANDLPAEVPDPLARAIPSEQPAQDIGAPPDPDPEPDPQLAAAMPQDPPTVEVPEDLGPKTGIGGTVLVADGGIHTVPADAETPDASIEGGQPRADPAAMAPAPAVQTAEPGASEPRPALEAAFNDAGFRVERDPQGRLLLRLHREIQFGFDRTDLPASAEPVLRALAGLLARYPDFGIEIRGHTDGAGHPDYNRDLSLRRARAVEAYLRQQGLAGERLSSTGLGEDEPLHPAAGGGSGLSPLEQRRIEIVMEPLAPSALADR